MVAVKAPRRATSEPAAAYCSGLRARRRADEDARMDRKRHIRPTAGNRRTALRSAGHRHGVPDPRDYSGTPALARKSDSFRGGPEPVQALLDLLRLDPGAKAIRSIVDQVDGEDWYNLGAAVRRIMARPLDDEEEALVARLGDNPAAAVAGRD